jgi:hypothetical protein
VSGLSFDEKAELRESAPASKAVENAAACTNVPNPDPTPDGDSIAVRLSHMLSGWLLRRDRRMLRRALIGVFGDLDE